MSQGWIRRRQISDSHLSRLDRICIKFLVFLSSRIFSIAWVFKKIEILFVLIRKYFGAIS